MASRLTPLFATKQGIRVRYLAGAELFTLVLPDNKVVSKVLQTGLVHGTIVHAVETLSRAQAAPRAARHGAVAFGYRDVLRGGD